MCENSDMCDCVETRKQPAGTVQSCKSCTLGEHSEFVLLEGL